MGISIRYLEHRDQDGNIIGIYFLSQRHTFPNMNSVDPDRSNPTRPRLERPLDTIRSFEAAIDGSYNRRQSYRAGMNPPHIACLSVALMANFTETPNPMNTQTRRSSYINGKHSKRSCGLSANLKSSVIGCLSASTAFHIQHEDLLSISNLTQVKVTNHVEEVKLLMMGGATTVVV